MEERLLRIREAAVVLGKPEMSLYLMIKNRLIPCVRLGRSIRIKEKDLQEYIKKNRK